MYFPYNTKNAMILNFVIFFDKLEHWGVACFDSSCKFMQNSLQRIVFEV